ncbi:Na(+)/H(+) antiporter subunit D [Brochothrix campestris FSL F6-1037]|uniref:Na(+)/H(+) antiporter subunit D n=2 Tax=Brochothrix campestris TaxID=2757 RepID=W7D3W4_9LIST|nr:Na(+)/H(+) antiporter subunit D [Brochothrix campestris FSL F6-1037]
MMLPTVILVAITAIFGVGIQFVTPYVLEASDSLIDPLVYITAVLGGN